MGKRGRAASKKQSDGSSESASHKPVRKRITKSCYVKKDKPLDPNCKWCKRLKSQVAWRGTDGLQCRSCPRVINNNQQYLKESKNGVLEKKLVEGSEFHQDWLEQVAEEEGKIALAPRHNRAALSCLIYSFSND